MLIKRFFLVLFLGLISFTISAQCAMCRAALESEGDTSKAEAINNGIVYLMAFPYIMVAIVFYVVYKMKFKKKKPELN
jgi:ABC-type spermidine/putrescine transport system permease subunit II